MKLSESLTQLGSPIAYYPNLARCLGSIPAAILLAQFVYWWDKKKHPYLYKTAYEIEKETGLSWEMQKVARKRLKSLGIISEKYARLQHEIHFYIDFDRLDAAWNERSPTSDTLIPESGFAGLGNQGLPDSIPETTPETTTLEPSHQTAPPPRKSQRPRLPAISPNFEKHYWSVSDADEPILVGWVKHWKEVYPLIDVEREMWKAMDWVSAHPEKHYTRWWSFLSRWIRNAQTYAERAQNG